MRGDDVFPACLYYCFSVCEAGLLPSDSTSPFVVDVAVFSIIHGDK